MCRSGRSYDPCSTPLVFPPRAAQEPSGAPDSPYFLLTVSTRDPAYIRPNCASRKGLIVVQHHGRMQRSWLRPCLRQRDEMAGAIEQAQPVAGSQGVRVRGHELLGTELTTVAYPGQPFIRDCPCGHLGQQSLHRDERTENRLADLVRNLAVPQSASILKRFQPGRFLQAKLAAARALQRLQVCAGAERLAKGVGE